MNTSTGNKIIYIKLFLAALFWGGNYVAGRVMSASLPPFTSAFLRFFAASVFLTIYVYNKYGKLPRINFPQILLIICIGLTGIVGFGFFFFQGLKYINAGRASIITSLNPSLITILSLLILREKMTTSKFAGIILSLSGAIIVLSKGNLLEFFSKKIGLGELSLLGCVLCWSTFSVLGKIAVKKIKPIITITYACLVGTLILSVPAFLEGQLNQFLQYDLTVWVSIIFQGFLGTAVAFNWYYEGIGKIGPTRAGIFFNFVPVFSTSLAVLILHERLYLSLVIGAIFVISGVFFTNYPYKKNKMIMEAKF